MGDGTRRDVAVAEALEFGAFLEDGVDGGIVGGGVGEEDVEDGLVEDGPELKIGGEVSGVAGLDEMDFVGAIGVVASGPGVSGVRAVAK